MRPFSLSHFLTSPLSLALLLLITGRMPVLLRGAQQTINVGSAANDGTGDTIRTALGKANANFSEIYTLLNSKLGVTNANVTASRVATFDANKGLTNGAATSTEIDYVAGVRSGIQAQIDAVGTTASNAVPGSLNTSQFDLGTVNQIKDGALMTNIVMQGGAVQRFSSTDSSYVQAAPYDTAAAGSVNYGPTTGETSFEFIDAAHTYQLRQAGTVKRAKVYVGGLNGITGFYIKIWRKIGTTYNLVAVSENLSSSLTASSVNTLSLAGLAVQEGDYIGARVEWSGGATVQHFVNKTLTGAHIYSVANATPSGLAYNWAGQTDLADKAVPIELHMAAPMFVTIGDSIISGATLNYSFADTYATTTQPSVAAAWFLGHALNCSYQNMGRAGETITQIATRFAADVVALKPKFVIIEGGVNDILGAVSNSTILAQYTSILTAAQAGGIVPIVVGVMPFRNYGSATSAMLQQRDALNASLAALVGTYGGLFVNADTYLGKQHPGGDAGNYWTLQARADGGDGIHLSAIGYATLARAIVDTITSLNVSGNVTFGSATLRGNVAFAGDSDKTLSAARNPATDADGYKLRFEAPGASFGATNRNGGDLELVSGTSTGTGTSRVVVKIPAFGSTGTADNAAADQFILYRSGTGSAYSQLISSSGNADHYLFDGSNYKGGLGYQQTTGLSGLLSAADGGQIVVGVDVNKRVSIGYGNANPSARLEVFSEFASSTNQNSATAKFAQDASHKLWVGYNTNNSVGMIGAVTEGATHDPLILNPLGGSLGLGLGTTPPNALVHFKTNDNAYQILETGISTNDAIYRMYSVSVYKGGVGYRAADGSVGLYSASNGSIPQVAVDTSNRLQIGQGTTNNAKLNLVGPSGTDQTSALTKFYTDSTHGIWMSYSSGVAYLGSINEGTSHDQLKLNPLGGTVSIGAGPSAQFDADATAGNTRFLLYDVTAGTLKRVSIGAADSGGAGFKVLRVPN